MSDENKFFRFVWRFNALLLAATGLLVIALLGWQLVLSAQFMQRAEPEPAGRFAPVPKAAEKNYTYRLERQPLQSDCTGKEIFVLKRWEGEPKAYGLADSTVYSSSGPEALDVNLLTVDCESGASHWLFRGYGRSIQSQYQLHGAKPEAGRQYPPVIEVLVDAVEADTDKDGKLTAKDRHSLYVYRMDANEAVRLLTADYILAVEQSGADKFLVIYENGKSAIAATYAIADSRLLSEKPLPNVPN